MRNQNVERLVEVCTILDNYPMELIQGHCHNLVFQLDKGTVVSDEHKERLNDLSVFNQSVDNCWVVFL